MLDTARTVSELSEFLRWMPTDASTPDFPRLRDGDPHAPGRKQTEILRTADRLRFLLPSVGLEGTKTLTEETTGS
ncbi:hypothetical protein DM868_10315 [Natronomonas salsuginis]|uniref:Uncharacterized protein n=2 Tax=Natronomonas salsuginis TaxID=2217661 RepID=A0A4U5JD78_9EURY|nr:hypothetical protein DM868_10315 [Natronomonas salsuginis]